MTPIPLRTACAALGIAYWMPLMAVRRRLLSAGPAPDHTITEAALQVWIARAHPPPAPSLGSDAQLSALEAKTTSLSGAAAAIEARTSSLEGAAAGLATKAAALGTAATALEARTTSVEAMAAELKATAASNKTILATHEAMFERMRAEPMLAAWLAPKATQ